MIELFKASQDDSGSVRSAMSQLSFRAKTRRPAGPAGVAAASTAAAVVNRAATLRASESPGPKPAGRFGGLAGAGLCRLY